MKTKNVIADLRRGDVILVGYVDAVQGSPCNPEKVRYLTITRNQFEKNKSQTVGMTGFGTFRATVISRKANAIMGGWTKVSFETSALNDYDLCEPSEALIKES